MEIRDKYTPLSQSSYIAELSYIDPVARPVGDSYHIISRLLQTSKFTGTY